MLEDQGARADKMTEICSCADLDYLQMLKEKGTDMKYISFDPYNWCCSCECGDSPDEDILIWLAENGGLKLTREQIEEYFCGNIDADEVLGAEK